jgi:hypothetical protein
MDENIEQDKSGILKLKDVSQLYTGKINIHSSLSNKYKKEIEKWIKEKHKNINYQYKISSYNGERYKGWLGLKIRDDI